MTSFNLAYSSNGTGIDMELHCLTSAKVVYNLTSDPAYTPQLIKTLPTTGSANTFEVEIDSFPVGFTQPSEGDMVVFALKNVNGSSVVGWNALLTIFFNTSL